MPRKRRKDSSGPPKCVFQKFALSVVTAEEVRAESDAESLVQMLVDQDAAFGKRNTQVRRLDLKDSAFKGDGVVVTDGAFLLDGEDQIKIDVRLDWNESGA